MEPEELREHLIEEHRMDLPAMEDIAKRLVDRAGKDHIPYEEWHQRDHNHDYKVRPEPDHTHDPNDPDIAVW